MQRIPWNKGLKKGIINNCLSCNKEVYTTKSRNYKFCSKKCYGLSRKGKLLSEEHKHKISISKIGDKNPMFNKKRSIEYKKYMSKLMGGKNNPFYRKKHSDESKLKMSNSSLGQVSNMKGKKHTIESRGKCSRNRKGKCLGSDNPAWNGGSSTYQELIRGKLKFWRKQVFERDDYTCQKCNKKGGNINAHHIIPVAECLLLKWEEEIFDIDNGLTLCEEHHYKKHHKKWLKINNI